MHTPDGILVLSKEGEIVYANTAVKSLVNAGDDKELLVTLNQLKVDDCRLVGFLKEHENERAVTGHIEWRCKISVKS